MGCGVGGRQRQCNSRTRLTSDMSMRVCVSPLAARWPSMVVRMAGLPCWRGNANGVQAHVALLKGWQTRTCAVRLVYHTSETACSVRRPCQ